MKTYAVVVDHWPRIPTTCRGGVMHRVIAIKVACRKERYQLLLILALLRQIDMPCASSLVIRGVPNDAHAAGVTVTPEYRELLASIALRVYKRRHATTQGTCVIHEGHKAYLL